MLKTSTKEVSTASMSMYRGLENSKRSLLYGTDVFKPSSYPRVLVVDDDPIFGKIIHRSASQLGVNLTYCETVTDFGVLGDTWDDYDVAIIDCDLGSLNGYQLVDFMELHTKKEIPVVLVSQTKPNKNQKWPVSVREFIHKKLGPFAILDAAFEAHEISKIYSEIDFSKKKTNH